MDEIETSSGSIARIIKAIEEIAFQTNILALNAAVEAARAGAVGAGFAVVADEVRGLAQRCAVAAKETAELIEAAISKSKEGKTRMDTVSAAVSEAKHVKTCVDQISASTVEQTGGVEQVVHAVAQVERVTQATAGTAKASARASDELNAQAGALKRIVINLDVMVGR